MDVTKVVTLMVLTGLVTTLMLPDRKTTQVLGALFNGASKFQATNMGLKSVPK